jgi:HAD superfamily hydrolase (TIGR01549 family)
VSKFIAFDVFGTLIKMNRTLNPYARLLKAGHADQRRDFMTQNKSIQQFCEELGLGHMTPTIERELQAELSALSLFDDVQATLQRLRRDGKRIALCSNLAHAYGDCVKALIPGMDAYIFSYEVGAKKPEPAIYQHVCDALQCKARDVTFIGDSPRADVEGPKAFGMKSKHLNRKSGITLSDLI